MTEYQCWFCGEGIERSDTGAILVTVENLWRNDAGSVSEDDPLQNVYAHSSCAKVRMQGYTMTLEPSIFGEDEGA
jgi:hypothetical protein